jgi:hypothetical protein
MHQGSESGYVHGCKCRACLDAHAVRQREYRADTKAKTARMKLELADLRDFKARVLSAVGQGEQG